MKFDEEINKVLNSRLEDTDMLNVFEVLNYSNADLQKAFNIALEMENRNLVKLLYSNFNTNKVIIEFTRLGKLRSID